MSNCRYRTPAVAGFGGAAATPRTVLAYQMDSTPPMFVYWFCIIGRLRIVSRLFAPGPEPTCVGPWVKLGVVEKRGPVSVELNVLVQSTWNFHVATRFVNGISAT